MYRDAETPLVRPSSLYGSAARINYCQLTRLSSFTCCSAVLALCPITALGTNHVVANTDVNQYCLQRHR